MEITTALVKPLISTMYGELCEELIQSRNVSLKTIQKRIGNLDLVASQLASAIQITTQLWHDPQVWLDEMGRIDPIKFKKNFTESFDEFTDEEINEINAEFQFEYNANK